MISQPTTITHHSCVRLIFFKEIYFVIFFADKKHLAAQSIACRMKSPVSCFHSAPFTSNPYLLSKDSFPTGSSTYSPRHKRLIYAFLTGTNLPSPGYLLGYLACLPFASLSGSTGLQLSLHMMLSYSHLFSMSDLMDTSIMTTGQTPSTGFIHLVID